MTDFYFALADRETVVHTSGEGLVAEDLQLLSERLVVNESFDEIALGLHVLVLEPHAELPNGYQWVTIRSLFAQYDEEACFRLARAKALSAWRQNNRFCPRCGHLLVDDKEQTARGCPACGNLLFPRIEPCVIMRVSRADGKILLARHVQRNQDIYACIAGFMEAGESAEHAVEREIFEETGFRVHNIRYYGSQSWPFPSQLMLGFTAEYAGGDLTLQKTELSDARWFDPDNCPASPQPGSLAYRLIHGV